MGSQVLPLVGLAVNSQRKIDRMDDANSHDGGQRTGVEDGDHHGQEHFFEATDKPKILGDCLVVGSDQVDCGNETGVPHPFGFYHLLLGLQEQKNQDDNLGGEEDSREEGAGGGKV